ncbi:type IX secretion system membrane protein PorP/SprF [candidate division KSB1 bacterium]|nr:type IX secretion system membrane protein PorP/SprF [candidate division KSB1 bacterium]
MKKNISIILIVLFIATITAYSQDFIRTNPADLEDPQSLFINPAVVPFQNMVLNLGMKLYHVGFVSGNSTALKHTFNSNSLPNIPFPRVGLGITTQSFNTPYFRTVGIGVSMAYSLSPIIALGVSANGLNINYDFDYDNVLHLEDPLFKDMNNWNVSFGFGAVVRPVSNFSFGIACNHINRPDLSLADVGARQPMIMDFGFKYYYNVFGASIYGHYQEDDLVFGILAEAKLYDKGVLKTGYHDRSFLAEGQLNLFKGISLIYRLEYPLNELNHYSYGSHQFGFSWNMKSNFEYKYNIHASTDTVKIIKQRSLIRIDKILADDLDRLFSYFGSSEFGIPENKTSTELMKNIVEDPSFSLMEESYNQYRSKLKNLLSSPQEYNSKNTIDIYCHDEGTAERAIRIRNYLINDIGINRNYIKIYRTYKTSDTDSLYRKAKIDSLQKKIERNFVEDESEYIELQQPWTERMIPERIYFNISNVAKTKVYAWRIEIRKITGKTVHTIEGYSQIPDLVEWDGFDADGNLINVGNYYCYFQHKSSRMGRWQPKDPKPKRITFVNITRDRIVRFTPSTPVKPEDVEIILQ